VDEASGRLTPLGHEPTRGQTPRNFNLTPDGRLLLVANQNSDNIIAFAIDPTDGSLTPTGVVTSVPTPVCIRFAPR
jgi:6-phosphogluconolactonase